MSVSALPFAVVFLLLMGVTIFVPSFPPAQLLYQYLRFPQSTMSIWGISIANLLNGITNGFFWLLIAATVYGLTHFAKKRELLPPMPVAPHMPTPPLEPMLVDQRANTIPPALTVPPVSIRKELIRNTGRKEPLRSEQDIEAIEGIGLICGGLLRNSGINTVTDLLRVCGKERGRRNLSNEAGVSYATLLKWVYRGDLQRVRGVGTKYATLLESAGVNTVTDLSKTNPRYLSQTLRAVNKERNIVRRAPPSKTIEIWVNNAKTLEPMVE